MRCFFDKMKIPRRDTGHEMVDNKSLAESNSTAEEDKITRNNNKLAAKSAKVVKSNTTSDTSIKTQQTKKTTRRRLLCELPAEKAEKLREANRRHAQKFREEKRRKAYSDLRLPMKRETKEKLTYLSKTYNMTIQDIIHKFIEIEYEKLMNDK